MQERIICPYCFANFYQDEVLDRVIGFLRKTEKPDEVIS